LCLLFVKTDPSLFVELLLPFLLGFHSVPSLTFSLTILAHVSIPNLHLSIFGLAPMSSVRASVLNTLYSLFQLRNLLLRLWCSVVRCRGLKTSSFQVREARDFRSSLFLACFAIVLCFVRVWCLCKILNVCMLPFRVWLDDCAGWSVTRPDDLAQVTRPRPGQTCRNRPRLALELSLKRRAFVWARHHLAQARGARLSEDAWGFEGCCCRCGLGEEAFLLGEGHARPGE